MPNIKKIYKIPYIYKNLKKFFFKSGHPISKANNSDTLIRQIDSCGWVDFKAWVLLQVLGLREDGASIHCLTFHLWMVVVGEPTRDRLEQKEDQSLAGLVWRISWPWSNDTVRYYSNALRLLALRPLVGSDPEGSVDVVLGWKSMKWSCNRRVQEDFWTHSNTLHVFLRGRALLPPFICVCCFSDSAAPRSWRCSLFEPKGCLRESAAQPFQRLSHLM